MISSYRAYGIRCVTSLPIPGFCPEPLNGSPPDLQCWINTESDWVSEARNLPSRLRYSENHADGAVPGGCTLTSFGSDEFFELAYGDGARFVIDSDAERLSASGPPTLSIEDLATYLRGPVMGFVLRRRRATPLHSAAACLGDHGIVLCGATEAGKSTTVAALALRGIRILSDDIAALTEQDGRFQVEPGYPWICLWPDAVISLFGRPDALPQLTPTWEKRYLPLGPGGFESVKRPLGAIYLLAPRTNEPNAPRVEEVRPREALLELVQNTYMNWLLDKEQRAMELDVLSRLASSVPVRRIVPHADPGRINELCEVILGDSAGWLGRPSLVGLAEPR